MFCVKPVIFFAPPLVVNMQLCATCSAALLGVLFLSLLSSSDCLRTVVRPDKDSKVTVSTDLPVDQCAVCTVSGVNDTQTSCHASLSLVPEEEVTLLFNCSQPIEQAYTVKITRSIECTTDSCNPTTGEVQPSLLTEFTRTFIWDIKAPEKTVVGLDILGEGLTEQSKSCSDGFQYSVTKPKPNNKVHTQVYCRGGSLTHLDLPNEAAVSLQVEAKGDVVPVLFQASAKPLKGRTMVITTEPGTTVIITRDPEEPECNVCTVDGSNPTCNPTEMTLSNAQNTSLEFSCLQPQDVFSVQIKKKIECTQNSCNPATGAVQPDLFKDFKRTLIWDMSVPEKTVLSLDFPGDGLKEIPGQDKCQDGYQYSLSTTNREGEVKTKTYCKSGPVSHLDLLGKATMTVEVPKEGELDSTAFTIKAAPRKSRMMSVTPDPDTIVTIRRPTSEPDCVVCVDKEPNQRCHTKYLVLRDARNTSVEFSCPQPQDLFTVEINREIDCTETSCTGDIVQAESTLFPDFNRTFSWDLKVPSTRAFRMEFPEPGMRQIPNGEICPDEHTYTIVTYLRTGPATIGTYCKGGTVTTIQVRYKGRMLLEVPGDVKLEPLDFKLSVGPETNMLAIVKVNLPRGVSETNFISANYPGDFPDNQQMMWDFVVPGMHNYTMRFGENTAPECLSKDVMVKYEKEDKKVTQLTLTDRQPEHGQGNFNMSLWNCETNRTLQGLTLAFTVSVMRSGHPVLCTVDLTKKPGVSLQIEKVGSDPYCEMSLESVVKQKIDVAMGTKASLSFLDCPNEDVQLTASEVIGCQNMNSCSVSGTLLTVPKLDSCLPMPLHSFTWLLNIPKHGTVDLMSATGGTLRQSLPGQECNDSVTLHVAEGDGSSIGDFCSKGIIRKVQVHSNVSVTTTGLDFTKTKGPFLNVSFSEEISESIIYMVSPKMSAPALLATPNWPQGMKPFSTVSWIVTIPSQYQAAMEFVNVSQPKCGQRHTGIKVQTLGSEEEMVSRREDEEAEDKLVVPESFYLNMSNCLPEDGQFGAVTKVILEKKTNLVAIVLGLVGALILLLTVLGVVCFIAKKKKQGQMKSESSIYIGRGNIFRPGDRHFSKTRSDNDSHVYASIDETMIYGHLLRDTSYADSVQDNFKGMQVDSYQTFTGPTDKELPVIAEPEADPEMDQYQPFLDPSETFIPSRPRTPIDRQDSLGFQDRRMLDNELNTFKSTGEINTIRLSGADLEPQPEVDMIMEESL